MRCQCLRVICCQVGSGMVTHDSLHIAELEVARDKDRLDEELVTGLGIGRRVLLHRLKEDCRRINISFQSREAEVWNGATHQKPRLHGRVQCGQSLAVRSTYMHREPPDLVSYASGDPRESYCLGAVVLTCVPSAIVCDCSGPMAATYLECDGLLVCIPELEDLGDLDGEGP